jgi:branched-chain amino acid transport system substrate-binding protein
MSETRVQAGISRRRFLKTLGVGLGTLAWAPTIAWAQQQPIKMGVLVPLILDLAVGVSANRGALLAQDEINAAGGILGRQIKLEVKDDRLDPRTSSQRFEELATQQKVLAIVGGFLDETTLPIMTVLPRVKTPFINTGTATPQTTDMVKEDYDNFKYYFRLMLDTNILTQDTVSMAKGLLVDELKLGKVALVIEDGAFGRDFEAFLKQQLPTVGLAVVEAFRFPQTGNFDFSSILSQSQRSGAQAFVVAIIRNNGFGFVRQWYDKGPRLPVVGINVSGQAFEYWQDSQGKVISHVYADAATGATAITEKTLPFFNAYVQRFTTAPAQPLFTGYTTYDSLYILKQAIERIGQGPPDPNNASAYESYRQQLVDALEQTDYVGTVGRVRFQGQSDPRPHDPFTTDPATGEVLVVPKWVQWQKTPEGKPDRKVVWPPVYRNSDFALPPS